MSCSWLCLFCAYLSFLVDGQFGCWPRRVIPLRIAADREKDRAFWHEVRFAAQWLPRCRFRRACMRAYVHVVCVCIYSACLYVYWHVYMSLIYLHVYMYMYTCAQQPKDSIIQPLSVYIYIYIYRTGFTRDSGYERTFSKLTKVIQVQWKLRKETDFYKLINGSLNQNRRSLHSNVTVSGGFGHKWRWLLMTRWRWRRKKHRVTLVPGIFSATFFCDPTTSWLCKQPKTKIMTGTNIQTSKFWKGPFFPDLSWFSSETGYYVWWGGIQSTRTIPHATWTPQGNSVFSQGHPLS